jgi:RNA polymerase sigma factor (sigma-70 family)
MAREIERKTNKPRTPNRPIRLITRVVSGDEKAWQQFIEAYAGFIYSLAWRYARQDVDVASDLFLFVLEGLRRTDTDGLAFYRLRRYLDSLSRYGGRSRFVTWLALVSKNLFRDWFREQGGRRILPKEIEGLDAIDKELFRLLFWEGNTEREAIERIRCSLSSSLTEAEFEHHIQHVYQRMTKRNFWTIYQELLRRSPALGIGSSSPSGHGRPLDVADLRLESRPDRLLELLEGKSLAAEVSTQLREAVLSLPKVAQNVVLLLCVQGVTGEECAKIMGFSKRQRVYDEMAKAKRKIKLALKKAGIDHERAMEATSFLSNSSEENEKGWFRSPDRKSSSVMTQHDSKK